MPNRIIDCYDILLRRDPLIEKTCGVSMKYKPKNVPILTVIEFVLIMKTIQMK